LPTGVCHWTPTTAFVGHQHVPSAVNQHTSWRSLIRCCCWISRTEQSVNPAARVGYHTRTISTSTQSASTWSPAAAASSDSVFRAPYTNFLPYLLTYKLLCKNKGPLTVSDDHLPVGNGKMRSVHSLLFPSSHSHSHETSLTISIARAIQWDPWKTWEFSNTHDRKPDAL